MDVLQPVKPGSAVGHTARYLAEKLRRRIALKEKTQNEGPERSEQAASQKKIKKEEDAGLAGQVGQLTDEALVLWIDQMERGTVEILKGIYGERWKEGAALEREKLAAVQEGARKRKAKFEESERVWKESRKISLRRGGVFLDDVDSRL